MITTLALFVAIINCYMGLYILQCSQIQSGHYSKVPAQWSPFRCNAFNKTDTYRKTLNKSLKEILGSI